MDEEVACAEERNLGMSDFFQLKQNELEGFLVCRDLYRV